jgi:hypothetical protein
MSLLRVVNAFYAALFLVLALVSLAFLSANLHDPENIWVSVGWVALFLLYAVLAFLNMRSGGADGPRDRLIALNAAAAMPMLAGIFAADTARFLCGVAALPFALTAAMLVMKRRGNPA